MRRILLALVIAGACVAPAAASAQAVRGVVLDDTNLAPVAGAMIRLVMNDELLTGRETDARGRFLMPVPTSGEYQLEMSRLGYETTRSQTFRVEMGDTVSVEFRVLPDAVLLAPLTVTARSNRGRDAFARRRSEWGRGLFLTPAHVDSVRTEYPAELLKGLENVDMTWGPWGLRSNGTYGPMPSVRTVQGRGCVLYMVDYVPVRSGPFEGGPWANYQLGSLEGKDVVAVEVYRSILEVPRELQRNTYELSPRGGPGRVHCGLVVFWTGAGW
jgi:hypothetical protein